MFQDIFINDDLKLTRLQYRYAYDIVEGMKDVEIYNNTLKVPFPYFLDDALKYIELIGNFEKEHQQQKEWAIIHNEKMVGAIGLHFERGVDAHISEIGYWLLNEHRKKGWMTLVVKALVAYAFKHSNLTKLKATVFEGNIGSARALEKAGFLAEGKLSNEYLKDQKLLGAISYGLSK